MARLLILLPKMLVSNRTRFFFFNFYAQGYTSLDWHPGQLGTSREAGAAARPPPPPTRRQVQVFEHRAQRGFGAHSQAGVLTPARPLTGPAIFREHLRLLRARFLRSELPHELTFQHGKTYPTRLSVSPQCGLLGFSQLSPLSKQSYRVSSHPPPSQLWGPGLQFISVLVHDIPRLLTAKKLSKNPSGRLRDPPRLSRGQRMAGRVAWTQHLPYQQYLSAPGCPEQIIPSRLFSSRKPPLHEAPKPASSAKPPGAGCRANKEASQRPPSRGPCLRNDFVVKIHSTQWFFTT